MLIVTPLRHACTQLTKTPSANLSVATIRYLEYYAHDLIELQLQALLSLTSCDY